MTKFPVVLIQMDAILNESTLGYRQTPIKRQKQNAWHLYNKKRVHILSLS